jgi:ABC-2 type transport system permease protein
VTALHGAAALDGVPMTRVNAPQPFVRGFGRAVREVWGARELLSQLVRKELKVKYKDSALGFLWSLLRPMLQLAVYYVAIGEFLGAGLPDFAVFLFCGLLAWSLFTDVLGGSTGSIVGNAGLVKKVYFPREVLPLAVVGAALVNFVLQLGVLVGALVLFGHPPPGWADVSLLPLALLALVLFMSAAGLLLAAANVYLRDVQHLLEVALLLWFWMTPIVYPVQTVIAKLEGSPLLMIYLMNPMANVVMGFQRALYGPVQIDGQEQLYTGNLHLRLLLVAAASAALLWLAQRVFARAQGNFAQEL